MKTPRRYPGLYEKGVPILIGLISLLLLILLVITLLVLAGLFPS